MLNDDYRDMLLALSGETVEYILIGAYAMAVHGHIRATGDMDIWVLPSKRDAEAVLRALRRFGAPSGELSAGDLQQDGVVYQIGIAPRRIEILTSISGVRFKEAAEHATMVAIDGIDVPVIGLDDLISNKRATGRAQDLADAEALQRLKDTANPNE
jgi:predicted nucleotidyltransferase